jgi:broad specificity phosphatase PhoE
MPARPTLLPKLAFLQGEDRPCRARPANPVPSWGERNVDMVERVHAVVDAVRDEFAGRQVVLVSHQAPIWVARLAFERRRLAHWPGWRRCTLASVTTLTFDGDRLAAVSYAEPAASALLGPEPGPDPTGGLRPDREAQ